MPWSTKSEADAYLAKLPAECCHRCKFFDSFDALWMVEAPLHPRGVRPEMSGQCKRHAPQLFVDNDGDRGHWPEVESNEWCGDFQPATEDRGIGYTWIGRDGERDDLDTYTVMRDAYAVTRETPPDARPDAGGAARGGPPS
jgi:hypothetical protein